MTLYQEACGTRCAVRESGSQVEFWRGCRASIFSVYVPRMLDMSLSGVTVLVPGSACAVPPCRSGDRESERGRREQGLDPVHQGLCGSVPDKSSPPRQAGILRLGEAKLTAGRVAIEGKYKGEHQRMRKKLRTMRVACAATALVAFGVLVAAPAASAHSGEYAEFNNCPSTNPNVATCLFNKTTGGEVI